MHGTYIPCKGPLSPEGKHGLNKEPLGPEQLLLAPLIVLVHDLLAKLVEVSQVATPLNI